MDLRSGVVGLAMVWLGVGQVAVGQGTPASATGTGTVTGHVVCDDTQRPARFAGVVLYGVPAQVTAAPTAPVDPNDTAALRKALSAGMGKTNMAQTKTGVDGSFVLNNVTPGEYYAFAAVPGYVSGGDQVLAALQAGADTKKAIPGVPIVHVYADRTAVAEVLAQRGAAVSGRVLWDDGTPASQVIVQAEAPKLAKLPVEFTMLAGLSAISRVSGMITDDQGRFRVSGLVPGDYVVKAMLSIGGQFGMSGGAMQLSSMLAATPVLVYAPDTVHRTGAKPVTLAKGEEHAGEDVTIRLGGMHSVAGRIRAVADGHGINSAIVKLTDVNDKEFSRSTGVDAEGGYAVTLVPPGTYKVEVTDAEDTRASEKKPKGLLRMEVPDAVRSYEDGAGSVIVSDADVTGQNFDLKANATQTKKPSVEDLLKPE